QGDVDGAIDALERAIQLDGNYAVAHAALSEAYLRKYSITLDPGWIPRAQASADAAIALDPSLPYAHAVRGLFYRTTGQHERAIGELQAALQADPGALNARRALAESYEAE